LKKTQNPLALSKRSQLALFSCSVSKKDYSSADYEKAARALTQTKEFRQLYQEADRQAMTDMILRQAKTAKGPEKKNQECPWTEKGTASCSKTLSRENVGGIAAALRWNAVSMSFCVPQSAILEEWEEAKMPDGARIPASRHVRPSGYQGQENKGKTKVSGPFMTNIITSTTALS
jgi:hypothetical protein